MLAADTQPVCAHWALDCQESPDSCDPFWEPVVYVMTTTSQGPTSAVVPTPSVADASTMVISSGTLLLAGAFLVLNMNLQFVATLATLPSPEAPIVRQLPNQADRSVAV